MHVHLTERNVIDSFVSQPNFFYYSNFYDIFTFYYSRISRKAMIEMLVKANKKNRIFFVLKSVFRDPLSNSSKNFE